MTDDPSHHPQLNNNNNNQNTQIDNNKRNVEIVWSGEPTLFLVNLQEKKDVLNGNVKSSPAQSILVPIAAPQTTDMYLNKINANHQLPVTKMDTKPPPPQYEEATKQVENIKKEQQQFQNKSQIMTDVLDILIQNGELPESAVYETKPMDNRLMGQHQQSPSTNAMRLVKVEPNRLSGEMVLTKVDQGGQTSEAMDIKQQADCDDSMDSFDMLFRQTVHQPKHDPSLDVKQKPPIDTTVAPYNNMSMSNMNNVVDIKPYEDLELMELMSQQLDMDIGLDPCPQYAQVNNSDHKQMPMSIGNGIINTNQEPKLSRRDMNPSLQPSLNELIKQKQCENLVNSYNNNFDVCHTTPMDIEEFENSLSSFDFHTIGDINNDGQINTPQHTFIESVPTQSMVHNHHIDAGHHNMQNGAGSSLSMNHTNILDLFNTDDFKMSSDALSWDDVDFAV